MPSAARHAPVATRLGELVITADFVEGSDAITGVYFPGHWRHPERASVGAAVDVTTDPTMAAMASELTAYLAGELTTFTTPLRPHGSANERRVWARLVEIPYGETTTYGAIATELGNPHLAQEVGRIVGENPISIAIPCHRVVGATGSLTGYAGGLERKTYLLELERFLTGQTLLDPRELH